MRRTRAKKSVLFVVALAICSIGSFLYGMAVLKYRVFPYQLLVAGKALITSSDGRQAANSGPQDLLDLAFTDELLRPAEQVFAPVSSLDGIADSLQRYMLSASALPNAYEDIEILGHESAADVLRVTYSLEGERTAYSFHVAPADVDRGQPSVAVLIVPGSGINQSSRIVERDVGNYHGDIVGLVGDFGDVYVFIKPNEDILAIHNGRAKLSYDFVLGSLINDGGSYSAYYLASLMATAKYLRTRYDRLAVLGLSQGGEAALIVSLQASPDLAVIASGYTVLPVRRAHFNQILVPGIAPVSLDPDVVRSTIGQQQTRYLFTYGSQEDGTYGLEAAGGHACEWFGSLKNVECLTHEGDHEFPENEVRRFLDWLLTETTVSLAHPGRGG